MKIKYEMIKQHFQKETDNVRYSDTNHVVDKTSHRCPCST